MESRKRERYRRGHLVAEALTLSKNFTTPEVV
jgi:hypothetical protein